MSMIDVPLTMFPSVFGSTGASALLDAAEEFVVQVIYIPKTGTLKRIGWRTGAVASGYVLKISVETVASVVGQPVATTNAGKTLYTANAESADITALTGNGIIYTAINETTGISVTAGDLVSVTWRLLSTTGGSVNIRVPSGTLGHDILTAYQGLTYSATYLGSTWNGIQNSPLLSLIYSDGFVPLQYSQVPCDANNLTYKSAANAYTGVKFQLPYKCRITGVSVYVDLDGDAEVILYDSDEYTVLAGPISLSNLKKASTSVRWLDIVLPSKVTIEANTNYRLIVRATTSTSILLTNFTAVDDATYSGYNAFPEGNKTCLTRRSSAPSSGDHTWTDTTADKPSISFLIDGIDTGSSGGISRSRQVMG